MNLELLKSLYMLLMTINEPEVKEAVVDYLTTTSNSVALMREHPHSSSVISLFGLSRPDKMIRGDVVRHTAEIAIAKPLIDIAIEHNDERNEAHVTKLPFTTYDSTHWIREPPKLSQRVLDKFHQTVQRVEAVLMKTRIFNHTRNIGSMEFPCLPQFATPVQKMLRKADVEAGQLAYHYDHDTNFKGTAMIKKVRGRVMIPQELPAFDWVIMFAERFLFLRGDSALAAAMQMIEKRDPIDILMLAEALDPKTCFIRPTSMDDYATKIYKTPPTAYKDYYLDEAFSRWRLAGPNPISIKPCSKEFLLRKVNIDMLPSMWRSRVDKALRDKRLFVCDYTVLGTMKSSKCGSHQKYSMGPIVLYEIPEDKAKRERQWLEPLAIQIDPIEKRPPMYTPDEGMHWTIAKMVVQSADGNFHEPVIHLGSAHLIVEPFILATNRHLPSKHPLSVLLKPHFDQTAHVNAYGEDPLFAAGGPVSQHNSGDVLEQDAYAAQQVLEKLSKDLTFPAQIRERGMDNQTFPAPYPYRDDGMLLWEAIRCWVDEYLRIYYGDDEETQRKRIADDNELKAWIKELASENHGRVTWLLRFDGSYRMLVDIIASIIFHATAHHATVNMSQVEMVAFVPAFPMGLYQRPPDKSRPATEKDLLDMMPPLEMAEVQKYYTSIGGIYYNRVGYYGTMHFIDPRVQPPLKRFQEKLMEIEEIIKMRNTKRVENWRGHMNMEIAKNWAYEYLLPTKIPNSIYI